MKKVIFFDMDGVLVDFGKEVEKVRNDPKISEKLKKKPDLIKDIFKNPAPYPHAIDSVHQLHNSGKYELFIATTSPWGNPESLTHKRLWIENHFGDLFKKKVFITHRKDLLMGDYLIDDRLANGAGNFKGELLRFGWDYENMVYNEYKDWASILKKLL